MASPTTVSLPQRLIEICGVLLLGLGLATAQVLIGGTRLLFSLPAYGLVGLAGVLAIFALRRAKPHPHAICLLSSALFFGYIIGRILLSPAPYVARTDLYIVLGALVVYGLTATVFTDAKARLVLVISLLVLGMVHAFIGAIQFRDGNNFMPIPFLQREDYGERASGFYVCPNHLAGLLEVLGLFGLSIVCWSRLPVWGKLLTGYVTAVCYVGAILTGSRGGYLSILASVAVFAVLSLVVVFGTGKGLRWKLVGAGLIVAVAAGFVVFSAMRKSSLLRDRATTIGDVSNIRFDLWAAAIEQWKLEPVFGTGAATYRFYGRKFRSERMQSDPLETHNDYLQLLAEYGIAGAVGFLIFFGAHLQAGWSNFSRLGPKRVAIAPRLLSNNLALQLAALAAVAACVVHSGFDFNLHIPANALLLAFVFGIVANPGMRGGTEPPRPTRSLLLARLAVPALAAVVVVQSVRLLPGEYYAELARTSLRDERLGDVLRYGLQALSYETQNPEVYAYLGRARLGIGYDMSDPAAQRSFYNAAVEAFETARALAPLEQTYPITLGLLYDLVGRFDDAERVLRIALELDPKAEYVRQYYEAHLERVREATNSPAAGVESASEGGERAVEGGGS
jgi:O-antigen ligase